MKRLRFTSILLAILIMASSMVYATEQEAEIINADFIVATPEEISFEESWELVLVNPWNELSKDYKFEHKKLANGLTVDERIYEDLNLMLSDCWKAGLRPVVCSAYRPYSTQQRLYRNKITRLRAAGYSYDAAVKEAGRWVAVPGTSEHHTGLALDIVSSSYQILDQKQEDTAEQKWLMEHCWEYGFILRYPTNKSDVTGIGYEPWHYRYVGREAAEAIKETGMCLEEYLQFLKQPLPLLIEDELLLYMKEEQEK